MSRFSKLLVAVSATATLTFAGLVDLPVAAINPPPGTSALAVAAGQTTTGIDAALHRGGAIAGHVGLEGSSHAVVGRFLAAVPVGQSRFYSRWEAETGRAGYYRITGIPTGDYYLCVNDQPPAGYLRRCFGTTDPPSRDVIPATARLVHVQAGRSRTINLTLLRGGVITGAVRAMGSRAPLDGAMVSIYLAGRRARSVLSNAQGVYRATGLPTARDYAVCVHTDVGTHAVRGTTSPTRYRSKCWRTTPWRPGAAPTDATPVRVRRARTTADINFLLGRAGAIAGSVHGSTGSRPPLVTSVRVFWRGVPVQSADGRNDGSFRVLGLNGGGHYTVCAFAGEPMNNSESSYRDRCWKDAAWKEGPVPPNARPISVTDRKVTRGVRIVEPLETYPAMGTITGRVTYRGAPVDTADLQAFRNGENVSGIWGGGGVQTAADGSFRVYLPAAPGYQICVDPYEAMDQPQTGFAGACYGGLAWNAGELPPRAATMVTVAPRATTRGVDIELGLGGAISGMVTHAGHPVGNVDVIAFNASRAWMGDTQTNSHGRYKMVGLVPSNRGYEVCFSLLAFPYADAAHDVKATGLLGQCYNDQPWSG